MFSTCKVGLRYSKCACIMGFLSLQKLVHVCREKWTDLLRGRVLLTPEVIVETVAKLERYTGTCTMPCILVHTS